MHFPVHGPFRGRPWPGEGLKNRIFQGFRIIDRAMANLLTTLRLALLLVAVALAYAASPWLRLAVTGLVAVVFALDGIDGWVARRRGEASLLGSLYDIAADRVVENVLWIVLADLDAVPVWVPLVFVARGSLVDAVRAELAGRGVAPFEGVRGRLARFLVASRAMRGAYGTVKAVAILAGFAVLPWPELDPASWRAWGGAAEAAVLALAALAVLMNLLRGLPVLVEFATRRSA